MKKTNKRNSSVAAYITLTTLFSAILIGTVLLIASCNPNTGGMVEDETGGIINGEVNGTGTGSAAESGTAEPSTPDTNIPPITGGNNTLGGNSSAGMVADIVEGVKKDSEAESESAPSDTAPTFIMPTDGYIAKDFSADRAVYSLTMNDYRTHNGIDIAAELDCAVVAAADGTVESVYTDDFMGKCIVISHDGGFKSHYMGVSDSLPSGIEAGAAVSAGQTIASIGESAVAEIADSPHLHFELTKDSQTLNPCDYME